MAESGRSDQHLAGKNPDQAKSERLLTTQSGNSLRISDAADIFTFVSLSRKAME